MQLFFNSDLNDKDENFCFDKNESRHINKVLRKKIGDKIYITNGKGYLFEAEIEIESHTKCKVKIINVSYSKPNDFKIHLAVAPTKLNDRYEWFIEKATEIGVNTITPIICKHGERKIIKAERYKKIIAAAGKQSLKLHFPKLENAIHFNDFIKKDLFDTRYIAHCHESIKKSLKKIIEPNKDILIMIGPEGDFDKEEIKLAEKAGFKSINLGNSRLRTETAAIVACHTIHLCND